MPPCPESFCRLWFWLPPNCSPPARRPAGVKLADGGDWRVHTFGPGGWWRLESTYTWTRRVVEAGEYIHLDQPSTCTDGPRATATESASDINMGT